MGEEGGEHFWVISESEDHLFNNYFDLIVVVGETIDLKEEGGENIQLHFEICQLVFVDGGEVGIIERDGRNTMIGYDFGREFSEDRPQKLFF